MFLSLSLLLYFLLLLFSHVAQTASGKKSLTSEAVVPREIQNTDLPHGMLSRNKATQGKKTELKPRGGVWNRCLKKLGFYYCYWEAVTMFEKHINVLRKIERSLLGRAHTWKDTPLTTVTLPFVGLFISFSLLPCFTGNHPWLPCLLSLILPTGFIYPFASEMSSAQISNSSTLSL